MKEAPVTALFLDVGGVLLTNGWDRHARERAAKTFDLDRAEMDERHHLTFDQAESTRRLLHFVLFRPLPQARRGHLSHCAGHRPGAGWTSGLRR